MNRPLAVGLTLLLVAALTAVFRVAQRYDPARIAMEREGRGPMGEINFQFENPTIIARTAGVEDWRVNVDRIDVLGDIGGSLENYRQVKFFGIRDGVFRKNGKPYARFRAQSATFDPSQQQFELTGEMAVRTHQGDRLTSKFARWSERDDFIRFPEGAEGKIEGRPVKSPQVMLEPRKRIVQCPIGAEVVLNGRLVRADSLYWDVEKGRVECPGTISGERKGMLFQAQSVVFNLKAKTMHAARGQFQVMMDRNDELEVPQ